MKITTEDEYEPAERENQQLQREQTMQQGIQQKKKERSSPFQTSNITITCCGNHDYDIGYLLATLRPQIDAPPVIIINMK